MNADKHAGFSSSLGEAMDVCTEATDVKSQEDDEDHHSTGENGINEAEDPRVIKTEAEDMEDERDYLKAEKEVEAEGGSEEDGFDGDRTEEDNEDDGDAEGEDEGDTPNEPQDLSLVDYSRYDGAALQDAHAAAADETYMPEAAAPRIPPPGKLSCDICGLSCISINVLLVHKRSHTGERPFHCTQCGASFTQKGNLLRHIKLHSGEKPFKCPMCSYACRRRDALSGHLRTHSVEKPFKCNHCNRSYKQRSSLEEHRERCHVYIQNKCPAERDDGHAPRPQMGAERALLLDRLASNVAKRKSSMPQKFTGDNAVCLDLSFSRDATHRGDAGDAPPGSPTPDGLHRQLPPPDGGDPPPSSRRPYPVAVSRGGAAPVSLANGHKMGLPLLGLPHAAPPLAVDPFHADGAQMPVMYSLGHLLNHQNGGPVPLSPLEALRAMRADGEAGGGPAAAAAGAPGGVYPCGHCRVIFLDYVMFTIHMGCHGFRDPLECNVCGHRSRDRYEFSSHIARGEHRLELK